MANLPEIETMRRDLERETAGLTIKEVNLTGLKRLFPAARNKKQVSDSLEGKKIQSVTRAFTLLDFHLDDDQSLIVDLGDGAYFRKARKADEPFDDQRFALTFNKRGQLRLIDPEQTSELRVIDGERFYEAYPQLETVGFDPIENPMPWDEFAKLLSSESRNLYKLLRDETFVIGLGAMYTDEILHSALLRYDRIASELKPQEVRRLHRAIVEVVYNAVKQRGSSYGGRLDLEGNPGKFDQYLEVYDRADERSRSGRGRVQTQKIRGQVHYYCDYQV